MRVLDRSFCSIPGNGWCLPFWRLALLLDLGEDALGLVVDAVRARGHLAITLDFLLAAHVAGLAAISALVATCPCCVSAPHPCDPPSLGVALLVAVVHVVRVEHAGGHGGRHGRAAVGAHAAEDARRVHERRPAVEAVGRIHGGDQRRCRGRGARAGASGEGRMRIVAIGASTRGSSGVLFADASAETLSRGCPGVTLKSPRR